MPMMPSAALPNRAAKDGNAVLLSEEEYRGMLATMELLSNQQLAQGLREGMAENPEDCAVYDPQEPW